MPVDLHLIAAVGSILIATLRVAKPSAQMFLVYHLYRALLKMMLSPHTLDLYSSGEGSTYVSSRLRYFSKSVKRFIRNVCFVSNGCPFIVERAREASSPFLNSIKINLDTFHEPITARKSNTRNVPLALPVRLIPWHIDILWFDGASLAREVF